MQTASSTPPPTARALSEAVKQWARSQRGSMSPDFMPAVTSTPAWSRPRSTPSIVQVMGTPATVAATCPARTTSPIWSTGSKTPSAGARSTRSAEWPAMTPGMPVLGAAGPSRMTCPR